MRIALAIAALALAGCGDAEERRVSQEGTGTATSPSPTTTPARTAPAETAPEASHDADADADAGGEAGPPDGHGEGHDGPEDKPGGAGDEIPASSPVMLTGRGGEITPGTVRVAPFIAIAVRLRSGDGATYLLRGGGQTLRASQGSDARVTFDGLRPGRRLMLRGTGRLVTIAASAEPGP